MNESCFLDASAIEYHYSNRFKLRGINLKLRRGDVLGLLGPNGSGKSSLLKILSGRQAPHSGKLLFCGKPLDPAHIRLRRQIGFLADPPAINLIMTISEYLHYAAALYRLPSNCKNQAVEQALSQCDLQLHKHQIIKTLSKGLKQRVALAQVIMHKPLLLLLDEPGDGLDPAQIESMRGLIQNLSHNCAIVFATHSYQDVENCCNKVLILNQGNTLYQGDFRELIQSLQTNSLIARFANPPTVNTLARITGVEQVEAYDKNRYVLTSNNCQALAPELMQSALQSGWQLQEIYPCENSLDTIFKRLQENCQS